MSLITRLADVEIAAHDFHGALFLFGSSSAGLTPLNVTSAVIQTRLGLIATDLAQYNEIIANYAALTNNTLRVEYLERLGHCTILLQSGMLSQSEYATALEITE